MKRASRVADLSDLITVCVITSPTASDPSTETIDTTIASVTAFDALLMSPMLVGFDDVRPEQRHGYSEYAEKHARFVRAHSGEAITTLRLTAWEHQANVMRRLLRLVDTPLLLFLEHDTPFTPDVKIDWEGCTDLLLHGELDSIRFLHESQIIPPHEHLMLGEVQGAVPYIRTAQWSQRPHLARTEWYRWVIDTYFGLSSRTMIEDVMHGVVTYYWNTYGRTGLDRFKLGIYADPEPTMQRSYHLDGRGGADKGGMVFAYAGETPEGAPAPTLGRVFE